MSERSLERWVWVLLFLAVFVRVWVAVSTIALVYPDEHFQTLEPASRAIFGFGWQSWEWYHGVRSWFVPMLYFPVLGLSRLVGFVGGEEPILACRVWMALWSGAVFWQLHQTFRIRKVSPIPHILALAAFAFSPAMINWSVTTFSDTWAMIFLVLGLPSLLRRQTGRGGILLGLTVLARPQMLAWCAGVFVYFAIARDRRKTLPRLALGFSCSLLVLGALDLWTWGVPFYSVFQNLKFNVWDNVAEMNGVSPWYAYFPWIFRDLGAVTAALLVGVPILARIRRKIASTDADRLIGLGSAVFVLAHIGIGHKELRFLLPIYPVLFYFFAVGLQAAFEGRARVWRRAPAGVWLAAILVCLAGSIWIARDRFEISSLDSSELTRELSRSPRLASEADPCIVVINLSWLWGRGEMLLGREVRNFDVGLDQLATVDWRECSYAVVGASAPDFAQVAGANWKQVVRDRMGNALYENR